MFLKKGKYNSIYFIGLIHGWFLTNDYQQVRSEIAARLLMKTLLLFVTVFKLASPSTLVAASTRLTAVFPSLAVPLAIAVTSFNYKNHNIKGCQKR